jgi:hypothetical protein
MRTLKKYKHNVIITLSKTDSSLLSLKSRLKNKNIKKTGQIQIFPVANTNIFIIAYL